MSQFVVVVVVVSSKYFITIWNKYIKYSVVYYNIQVFKEIIHKVDE